MCSYLSGSGRIPFSAECDRYAYASGAGNRLFLSPGGKLPVHGAGGSEHPRPTPDPADSVFERGSGASGGSLPQGSAPATCSPGGRASRGRCRRHGTGKAPFAGSSSSAVGRSCGRWLPAKPCGSSPGVRTIFTTKGRTSNWEDTWPNWESGPCRWIIWTSMPRI